MLKKLFKKNRQRRIDEYENETIVKMCQGPDVHR